MVLRGGDKLQSSPKLSSAIIFSYVGTVRFPETKIGPGRELGCV